MAPEAFVEGSLRRIVTPRAAKRFPREKKRAPPRGGWTIRVGLAPSLAMRILLILGLAGVHLAACKSAAPPHEPEPRRVCVLRHGESFRNLETPPTGLSARELDGLTERGREQARRARERLALGQRSLVVSSPVTRALETAAIVAGDRPVEAATALHYLEGERTPAAALPELLTLIEGAFARAPAPSPLVLVTHSDISALLLGEAEQTPLDERAARHTLEPGAVLCVTWRRP